MADEIGRRNGGGLRPSGELREVGLEEADVVEARRPGEAGPMAICAGLKSIAVTCQPGLLAASAGAEPPQPSSR